MDLKLHVIFSAIVCLTMLSMVAQSKKVHHIHWNKNNPMFMRGGLSNIVDVNVGNLPSEYDQVNIICPRSKPGTRYPERHVIYSVSREEYMSCRITNPKPKIIAVCSKPHQLLYFTITFRSFTPTPGGLEFHPGKDYYFISTSSREDLHRRVGGGCASNNMRMVFRVADNSYDYQTNLIEEEIEFVKTSTTTKPPQPIRDEPKIVFMDPRTRFVNYGYLPYQKIVEEEVDNAISNEVRNKALPYTSDPTNGSTGINGQTSLFGLILATLLTVLLRP